ncbi:OsmC family protein [Membranihabitans marinus]|uniref:OsmC family protein n=1 Tax=Membranihabitans marinus TaxID=1227546 RepID=UPI001F3BC406|nr:OsmC family protein [Membranihabitans marinus]
MATKINIKNLPVGYQSIISNGHHSIVGDEPLHSKGTDLGLSPTELVLSGLAMCKVATVRFIARKKNYKIGNVDAHLEQKVKRGNNGQLSTEVEVAISIEGDITESQRRELIEEADHCYIHRMLNGDWDIASAKEWNLEE